MVPLIYIKEIGEGDLPPISIDDKSVYNKQNDGSYKKRTKT